ncbi:MAG: tetratricopeptide repeat protein [Saccharothrix sp.]|nr:tetratricopeptide repeat protein [Saccharothrix sp.]
MPRQLPLAVRDFTGRKEYVAGLDALLSSAGVGGTGAVVISAVDGAAGIGKTSLAVWWAHRVQDRFPDGTLHVNLRGYGPGDPASPAEVLEGFLRALGVRAERIPAGVEALAGAFRSLLAGRRVLIVLDNANSADQVRPLLPGTPGCVVVVTSRESLTGLVVTESASRLTLDLLSVDEAVELVAGILGPARAAAEPGAIGELVRYCARLPLALRIAAGQAAGPNTTVAEVVAELADERYRLDVLSRGGDERSAMRTVFDWSYQRLASEHARVFRCLGLHPGQEFGVQAAAAATGLDVPTARRVLALLAEAHLIEPTGRRGRYRFHDLLRAYAAERADHDDTLDDRERTRQALLEWYAGHARTAHQILFPAHRDWYPALRLAVQARPETPIAGRDEAWAWLDLERDNLVAAVREADRHDQNPLTLLLAVTSGFVLAWRGHWDDLFDVQRRALAAARRSGDRIAEAHALLSLGETHREATQWPNAHNNYQAARELASVLGDPWLEAATLNELARLCLEQGQYAQARNHLLAALPLAPEAQHGRLEAVIESNLGEVCIREDDHWQSLHHAHRSLILRRQAQDRGGEAGVLHLMARAHHGMGDHRGAIALCEQALDIEEHHRVPRERAEILNTLGTLLRDTDTTRALRCWREALRIYDDFGDHRAADLRDRLHALETQADRPSTT